jgi:predicted TIM-barrel fold metal-dependent hydrolase
MKETLRYDVIDMHAHIFPDKIAERAVESIGKYYNIPMSRSGTVNGLLEAGSRINVSKYVVHSSATHVEQVKSINDYVFGVQSSHKNLIGFGTLHPGLEDADLEVERIISMGLHGIKLHPEFQEFCIDDDAMLPVYKAIEGRLPLLIHMGDQNTDSSSPVRLAGILDMFPELVIIAAHFGGYSMWDESMKHLIGKNLFMDTSSTLAFLDPGKAVEMIRKHGVHKMLFGTDYPMWDHKEELGRFLMLELNEEERRAILYGNAQKLLS